MGSFTIALEFVLLTCYHLGSQFKKRTTRGNGNGYSPVRQAHYFVQKIHLHAALGLI
jgi:hypothetical protein